MKTLGPKRQPVADPRYSVTGSGVPVEELDFSTWWTDFGLSASVHYLHALHKDGETTHRVHCRSCERPRLEMRDGTLYWLVDRGP